ncbi:MAG: peptidylprolyl isomerase [Saprospiraceae bacterium]|nr:peptidylprolyl isomerase [Saprospiraceae bacterium]
MALITKIRRNLWLVLILLGLALAAFILMDMTSSQNLGGGQQFNVGEVGDETISWNDFQNAESVLYAGSSGNVYSRRNTLWNYLVRASIVEQEAEEIGVAVTEEEMQELQFGNNISPVIQRNFADPNTGRLNMEALNNFREALNAGTLPQQSLAFWNFQEGQVKSEALQSKINTLVVKGMYMPGWNVTKRHYENNNKVDFDYVKVSYDEVEDAEVTVTDEDLQAYIEANAGEYESDEETRSVAYVEFEVTPTSEDTAMILEKINELKSDLEQVEDDSLFITNNYGIYETKYFKAGELSPEIMDTVTTMEEGDIYGPYRDGGEYRVAKLVDKKVIPDSVQVRHILRSVTDQPSLAAASSLIDSLKNVIESGEATFDSLAMQFSQDGSAAQGGDLGITAPGRMVQPFNDLIFYRAEEGKLYTVATQFGLHLVEVTDQVFLDDEPSYRMAYLKEAIIPSEETQNVRYDEVVEFISENRSYEDLQASVNNDEELEFLVGNGLTENSFVIGDLGPEQASRDIVKWAFSGDVEPGDVSPEVYVYEDAVNYFNSKYVVVSLTAINPPGLMSVASVRDEIEPKVRNEKKGQLIASRISTDDLGAIADQFNTTVDTAVGAVFISGFVPGVGSEPEVIGSAFSLEEGESAGPIIGNSGVYYIRTTRKEEALPPNNIAQLRKVNTSQYPTRVSNGLMDAMKKMIDIEDQRSTYY